MSVAIVKRRVVFWYRDFFVARCEGSRIQDVRLDNKL